MMKMPLAKPKFGDLRKEVSDLITKAEELVEKGKTKEALQIIEQAQKKCTQGIDAAAKAGSQDMVNDFAKKQDSLSELETKAKAPKPKISTAAVAEKISLEKEFSNRIKYGASTDDLIELGEFLEKVAADKKYWLWKQKGGEQLRKNLASLAESLKKGNRALLKETQLGSVLTILIENPNRTKMPKIFVDAMKKATAEEIVGLIAHASDDVFFGMATLYNGAANSYLNEMVQLLPDDVELRNNFKGAMMEGLEKGETPEAIIASFKEKHGNISKEKLLDFLKTNPEAEASFRLAGEFSSKLKPGILLPEATWSATQWKKIKQKWHTSWKKAAVVGGALALYLIYTGIDYWGFEGTLPLGAFKKTGTDKWIENNVKNPKDLINKLESEEEDLTSFTLDYVLQWKYREHLTDKASKNTFDNLMKNFAALQKHKSKPLDKFSVENLESLIKEINSRIKDELQKPAPDRAKLENLFNFAILVGTELKNKGGSIDTLISSKNTSQLLKLLSFSELQKHKVDVEAKLKSPLGQAFAALESVEGVKLTNAEKSKAESTLKLPFVKLLEQINKELERRTTDFPKQNEKIMGWLYMFSPDLNYSINKILGGVITDDEVRIMEGKMKPSDKNYTKTLTSLLHKLNPYFETWLADNVRENKIPDIVTHIIKNDGTFTADEVSYMLGYMEEDSEIYKTTEAGLKGKLTDNQWLKKGGMKGISTVSTAEKEETKPKKKTPKTKEKGAGGF